MLAMMMACVPAMALEADAVFGQFDNDNAGSWAPPYDHSVWKKLYGFDLKQTANITAKVYDVLLYICNQATYCNNLSYKYQNPIYHAEYWPNLDWRIAEREAMMELVNADLAE